MYWAYLCKHDHGWNDIIGADNFVMGVGLSTYLTLLHLYEPS